MQPTNIAIDFSQLDASLFSINALLVKLEVVENKSKSEVIEHAPHSLNSWPLF